MYDELYEAWKQEKESADLQTLSKDFYIRLTEYVKRLREETRMMDRKTMRGQLLQRELKNAKRMIQDIVRLRFKKALESTIIGKDSIMDTLTTEEKTYGKMLSSVELYRDFLKGLLKGNLGGSLPPRIDEEEKPKRLLVRFVQEIPAIIGSDMKEYGPFRAEDIATLPAENAKILIKEGAAVEIDANR